MPDYVETLIFVLEQVKLSLQTFYILYTCIWPFFVTLSSNEDAFHYRELHISVIHLEFDLLFCVRKWLA